MSHQLKYAKEVACKRHFVILFKPKHVVRSTVKYCESCCYDWRSL